MKQKVIALITLLILTLPLLSCSTLASQNRSAFGNKQCSFPPYIYGGVVTDVFLLSSIFVYDEDSHPLGHAMGSVATVAYVVVDFPLSLVADTIILPVSIYRDISECLIRPKPKTDDDVVEDSL